MCPDGTTSINAMLVVFILRHINGYRHFLRVAGILPDIAYILVSGQGWQAIPEKLQISPIDLGTFRPWTSTCDNPVRRAA